MKQKLYNQYLMIMIKVKTQKENALVNVVVLGKKMWTKFKSIIRKMIRKKTNRKKMEKYAK